MPLAVHRELCARLLVPESERLARIWEMLADETDARLLLATPGTAAQLAQRVALPAAEAERRLAALYHRGVAFQATKAEGIVYRAPRHLVQLHDASVQWPEAPLAFLDLWKEFMEREYPGLVRLMVEAGFPAFMRAVPTLRAVEALGGVEPFEDVAAMVRGAEEITVCRCPCRLAERNCDAPLEVCIQLGKGARYAAQRGIGRVIGKEEALAILRRSAEAGLVHCVDNRKAVGHFICNCCRCCCAIIKPTRVDPACRPILAPSRYRAEVVPEVCTADGLCVVVCPVQAVTVPDGAEAAVVDRERCIGCGLCLSACVSGALSFRAVREADFIPD